MKKILIVLAIALVVLMIVGCVSTQDQERLNASMVRKTEIVKLVADTYAELSAKTKDIIADVKEGKINKVEATDLIELYRLDAEILFEKLRMEHDLTTTEIRELEGKGYGGWELAGSFLLSVITALGGVRAWRGSTSNRNGNIGVV